MVLISFELLNPMDSNTAGGSTSFLVDWIHEGASSTVRHIEAFGTDTVSKLQYTTVITQVLNIDQRILCVDLINFVLFVGPDQSQRIVFIELELHGLESLSMIVISRG